MLKRALSLGLGAVAAASFVSFAGLLSPAGCQSTCATAADCGSGSYCSTAVDVCLSAEVLGFCRAIPTSCPSVVEPVCGCDGNQYQNQCMAAQAGFSVSTDGPCSTSCGGPSQLKCTDKTKYCHFADNVCGAGNAVGTCDPVPTGCMEATPLTVCGCDGNTYASLCDAQVAGTSVNTMGPCPCGGPDAIPCGEAGTFCQLAQGACTSPDPAGTCVTIPSATSCSAFSSPVCGCDGHTYANACAAAQMKVSVATLGLCPCGGPGGVACAATEFCSYPQSTTTGLCLTPGTLGNCEPRPTTCAPVLSPVCGCDGVNYDNPCLAAKAGTAVAVIGGCPTPDGGADGG